MSGVIQPPVRAWRLEHPSDGIGPFNSRNNDGPGYISSWSWRDAEMNEQWCPNPHRMPHPNGDRLLRRGDLPKYDHYAQTFHLKFAFTTVRALRWWFCGRALQDLTSWGYVLHAVQVPWVAHQRWQGDQLRYDSRRATIIRTMAPVQAFWL